MADTEEIHIGCVIYPVYLNRNSSVDQGRKVPLDLAVSNPTAKDIAIALQKLKVPFQIETEKRHPSDFTMGRVKAVLKHENGSILNSNYPNKRQLLLAIGAMLQEMNGVSLRSIDDME